MSEFYTHESVIVDLEFCWFLRFLLTFYVFLFFYLLFKSKIVLMADFGDA